MMIRHKMILMMGGMIMTDLLALPDFVKEVIAHYGPYVVGIRKAGTSAEYPHELYVVYHEKYGVVEIESSSLIRTHQYAFEVAEAIKSLEDGSMFTHEDVHMMEHVPDGIKFS